MSSNSRYDDGYDENSPNAMFSRIMLQLENQDKVSKDFREALKELAEKTLIEVKKTNGRVTKLENERWFNRGVAAAIGTAASAVWAYLSSSK